MSRPRLQVHLTDAEDQQLYELREAASVPNRTKRRAEMLRLNHRGWTTEQIAEYLGCRCATVRRAIHRWQQSGIDGLWDAPRQGRPLKWQASDFAVIEQRLAEPGTFNSRQVVELLASDCDVHLSRRHVSRLLKKRGIAGSAPVKATNENKTPSPARRRNAN